MDPDFADRYFNQQAEQLKESGQSEESIQAQLADMEKYKEMYKNPFVQLGFSFLEIFPVGLIITLICALLLKRKN
jgi:flagellar biosynthesis chaperone FliJ